MNTTIYQLFGSGNSQDVDLVFFVEKLPESILEKLLLSKELSLELASLYPNQHINPNLAICEKGSLIEVYKGTTDELNNALYYTYHLHQQEFDNQIKILLNRDVDLKFLRSSRMILSFLSKTNYRSIIKIALKEDVYSKINTLKKIDFTTISNFGKGQNSYDTLKSIAFQIGQSIALHEGKELYEKNEIGNYFPDLKKYLFRVDNLADSSLQFWLSKYIKILNERAKNMKFLDEYKYEEVNKT